MTDTERDQLLKDIRDRLMAIEDLLSGPRATPERGVLVRLHVLEKWLTERRRFEWLWISAAVALVMAGAAGVVVWAVQAMPGPTP